MTHSLRSNIQVNIIIKFSFILTKRKPKWIAGISFRSAFENVELQQWINEMEETKVVHQHIKVGYQHIKALVSIRKDPSGKFPC